MSAGSHFDDDRLSALIDGEAPPEDVAHAATCVECGALVEAWRRASQLVSFRPSPPPTAQRDDAVQAALASMAGASAASTAGASAASTAGPVELGAHRSPRRRRPGFVGGRIAAAAAVVVIAGTTLAVVHNGGGHHGSSNKDASAGSAASATTATVPSALPGSAGTAETQSPAGVSGPQPSAAGTAAGAAAGGVRGAVLGNYNTTASMVAALRDALGTGLPGASPVPVFSAAEQAALQACLSQARAAAKVPAGSQPVLETTLWSAGRPALAFVFSTAADHVAAVVRMPGCQLLSALTF